MCSQAQTISQAAGFKYPTNFVDGRPDLKDRYTLANGRLVFDAYFNTRFEIRENNNDFDSSINDPKDASWQLTRFRLGALFHANEWLKFYVQGQDIRELEAAARTTSAPLARMGMMSSTSCRPGWTSAMTPTASACAWAASR